MKAVEVRGLWWRYASGRGWALRDVSFELEEGEMLGVLGPSGAGKTTLCLSLAGVIPHGIRGVMRGRVRVFGRDTSRAMISDLARLVGVVFQDPDTQFVTMRVLDEVAFPLENMGVERGEMLRRCEEALRATGMWELRHRYPFELSGGQKQRVAIAAMLARRPKLLILDEPTSDLDPVGRREVFEVLARLREEHRVTLIVVEHRTEELLKYADKLLVLRGGEVVAYGRVEEVLADVERLKSAGVRLPAAAELALRVFKRPAVLDGRLPVTLEEGVRVLQAARSRMRVRRREERTRAGAKPVIKLVDAWYVYPDGTAALRGVSLEVYRGELLAVIGRNGSGKTTMAKLMVGLYKPTKGRVEILGEDSRGLKASDVALRVGYVYQNPDHQLFCETVYEEVAYALFNAGLPREEVDRRVVNALKQVHLNGLEEERPYFLSKGERQRLALAVVLAMDPEVLIVDEPTTGQDPAQSREIMELLRGVNARGKTVVVITHDMELVAEYASRVAVLSEGRLLAVGPPRAVLADEELMSRAGLEPPQIVELSLRLFGEPLLSVEEVVVRE